MNWDIPDADMHVWRITGSDSKTYPVSGMEYKLLNLFEKRYDSFGDTEKWHIHLKSLGIRLTENKRKVGLSVPDPHTKQCWIPLWISVPEELAQKILVLGGLP